MNRVDRLLGYLLVFQNHDLVRAQDLATRFEVSERTVYRDIEALYEVGVPLVGMPGEGYQLMPGYYLPPVMFTAEEAQALFLAMALLTGLTEPGPTHDAAETASEKVRVILPKTTLAQIEALQAVVGFYNMGRHKLNLDSPIFHQLQQAIQQQRVVTLRYHSKEQNEQTERTVEPLGLAYLDHVWVLTAWCRLRRGQRTFRLDRIDRLTVSRERFPARAVEHNSHPETSETIILQVDAAVARWVREAQHFAFSHETTTADGAILMHYRMRDQERFLSWILQWGASVEIHAPIALRHAMQKQIQTLHKRYQD